MKKFLSVIVILLLVAVSVYSEGIVEKIMADKCESYSFEWMGNKVDIKDSLGNDSALLIYNDTAYIPVRTIGELIGEEVNFDENGKTISIGREIDDLGIEAIQMEYFTFGGVARREIYDFKNSMLNVYYYDYIDKACQLSRESAYPMFNENKHKFFEKLKETSIFEWEESYVTKDTTWFTETEEIMTISFKNGNSKQIVFHGAVPEDYSEVDRAFRELSMHGIY